MAWYYPITNDAGETVAKLRISSLPYRVALRRPGHRNFEWQKQRYRTKQAAFARLCRLFASGQYKRGIVSADSANPYYDPRVVCELVQQSGARYE